MSFDTLAKAAVLPAPCGGSYGVMMAIASFANKGHVCTAEVETIAARCKQSVRSVIRHIASLEGCGLITKARNGHKNEYSFVFDKEATQPSIGENPQADTCQIGTYEGTQTCQIDTITGEQTCQIGTPNMTDWHVKHDNLALAYIDKPRFEPRSEPIPPYPPLQGGGANAAPRRPSAKGRDKSAEHPDFAVFYAAYPNKKAPERAAKAFAKARKSASLQEILDGLERYRLGKPDWQEWAHPARWLNDKRWQDEYQENQPITQQKGKQNHAKLSPLQQRKLELSRQGKPQECAFGDMFGAKNVGASGGCGSPLRIVHDIPAEPLQRV